MTREQRLEQYLEVALDLAAVLAVTLPKHLQPDVFATIDRIRKDSKR